MKKSVHSAGLIVALLSMLIVFPEGVQAQLERERVVEDRPIEFIFQAPTNIGLSTVQNVAKKNLNTSVLHTFGLISGGIDRFYGLDDGANTRIGLDYGLTDRFSAGIGRMTFQKVVDIRTKFNILRQTTTGSTPVDLAVKGSAGISTLSGMGLDFSDRLSYLISLMAARKFNGLSVQLSPMIGYFNNVVLDENPNRLFGVGLMASYDISDRYALSAEYLPVIGDRFRNTTDTLGVALNIDTGGHVFQIFLTSSQWHNEQFIMANNRDRFWEGDFRFGFNIHRTFGF
jgi:hypothetical protein